MDTYMHGAAGMFPCKPDYLHGWVKVSEAQAEIARLQAEVERLKSRGDNHWETMRCIYRIATEDGDMQAVIQHIKDAGHGYTERPEETLRRYQTELATAWNDAIEAAYSAAEQYPADDMTTAERDAFIHGCMAARDAIRALRKAHE